MASADQRLSTSQPSFWVVLGLSVVFLCLNGLLIVAPTTGASIFGIPAPGNVGDAYLRAIGFRDAALAFYLAGLACFSSKRSVIIVLAASILIPVCDLVLVIAVGTAAWWQIGIHALSGVCLAGAAALLTIEN